MDNQEWDGVAFRSRMAATAEGHERYINEHKDRLLNGRSNGSKPIHDRWLGEWWIYYRLAGRIETNSKANLIAELRRLAESYPGITGAYDQETAESGYMMAIGGLLHELGEKLPCAEN